MTTFYKKTRQDVRGLLAGVQQPITKAMGKADKFTEEQDKKLFIKQHGPFQKFGKKVYNKFHGPIVVGVMSAVRAISAAIFNPFLIDSALKSRKAKKPHIGEVDPQGAEQGNPIPVVKGQRRLSGNMIWWGKLRKKSAKFQASKAGTASTVSYQPMAFRSFLVGVCEGQAGLIRAWAGATPINIGAFTWFDGDDNVGLAALTGAEYTTYKKLACAYFDDFYLGTQDSIPNFTFEVRQGEVTNIFGFVGFYATFSSIGTHKWAKATNYEFLNMDVDGTNGYRPQYNLTILTEGRVFGIVNSSAFSTSKPKLMDGNLNVLIQYTNTAYTQLFPIQDPSNLNEVYVFLGNSYLVYDITSSSTTYARSITPYQGNNWSHPDIYAFSGKGHFIVFYSTIYVNKGGLWLMKKSDGTLVQQYLLNSTNNNYKYGAIIVHKGKVYCFLRHAALGDYPYYFWRFDIDSRVREKYQPFFDGASISSGPISLIGYTPNRKTVFIKKCYDGNYYIFAACTRLNTHTDQSTLYKYDLNGTVISKYITGHSFNYTNPISLSVLTTDGLGRIVVGGETATNQDGFTGNVMIFDDNLILMHTKNVVGPGGADHVVQYASTVNPEVFSYEDEDRAFSVIIKEMIESAIPAATINEDSFDDAYQYCIENGLVGSFIFVEQKPVWDQIDYVCSHFGGFLYKKNGEICLGFLGTQSSIITLTNSDFVRTADETEPPIMVSRRSNRETLNRVEVVWTDRNRWYAYGTVVALDDVAIRISHIEKKETMQLDGITSPELAVKMANRLLVDSSCRIRTFTFVVSYKNMVLEVNDVITLNDGNVIIDVKVRIVSVTEDMTGKNLVIEAIEEVDYPEFSFGTQENEHDVDATVTLGEGVISFRENDDSSYLWLSIAPTVEDTNGWYIYMSYDDTTYTLLGRCDISDVVDGSANSRGILTTTIPAYTTVIHRPTDSFTVNIGTVTDLASGTDLSFFNNHKLCKIDDEIIAYKTSTETPSGSGVWVVSNLIRGLFGTNPVAHSAGASFSTLDINYSYFIKPTDIGKTLYFKAAAYYGEDQTDVGDATAYSVQIKGSSVPFGAGLVRLTAAEEAGGGTTYSGATFTLYWNLPGKKGTGFNQGNYSVNDSYPLWDYGDPVSQLVGGNGVNYGNYLADTDLQYIDLKFYTTGGTLIGQRSVSGTTTSETITKATDLGDNVSAVIKVIPRTSYPSIFEASITVTQV